MRQIIVADFADDDFYRRGYRQPINSINQDSEPKLGQPVCSQVFVRPACKKTVSEKGGEDKKGIMGWFKADSMHDCDGCKGKITFKGNPAGKSPQTPEYKHVCSKCGPDSAFTCATHKG